MTDIEPDIDEKPWVNPWSTPKSPPWPEPEKDEEPEPPGQTSIPEVDLTRAQRYHERQTRKNKRARRGQPK